MNQHDNEKSPGPRNAVERFYERFRKVPLRYLDLFIAACGVALALVVALGMLKGHGLL